MKKLFFTLLALCCLQNILAQQNDIKLQIKYGSDNNELQELMRFQGIETSKLTFSGDNLKGKNYMFLLKQFTNGKLVKTDTLADSKRYSYIPPIDSSSFSLQCFVKTQLNNKVKISFRFPRFATPRLIDIEPSEDEYALHSFSGNKNFMNIKLNTPTYILTYFLPYVDKEFGWKKYCDVSGSEYGPEEWGQKFNIPNYFLIEVLFEE